MNDTVKYVLDETRIPKRWYNIMADLPSPPPPVREIYRQWRPSPGCRR